MIIEYILWVIFMKKMLIILIILFPQLINAATNDTKVTLINAPNGIYYYKKYLNGTVAQQPASIKVINNQFDAFCLETGIAISKDFYSSSNVFSPMNVNFTNDEIKKMQRYAAFGYEFPGHNNLNYYLATQELIWRVRPTFSTFKWLKSNNVNLVYDITAEKDEINHLIKEFDTELNLPKMIKGPIGSEIVLTEKNKILHNYKVTSNNAVIKNDDIIINFSKTQDEIVLSSAAEVTKPSIFYTKKGFQTLGKLYLNETKNFVIDVNAWYTANFNIYTRNKKSKKMILEDVLYILYDDQMNKLKTFTSNQGKLIIPLNEGNYYLQQASINNDYLLNNELFSLIIDENQHGEIDILVENMPIEEGKILINSYDSINLKIIEPVIYDVWQNDKLIFSGNKSEVEKMIFGIGNYQIKVKQVPDNYELPNKSYPFIINKHKDLIDIKIMLNPIIEIPQTDQWERNNNYDAFIIFILFAILASFAIKLYHYHSSKKI